jgi:hypothetical protein
MQLYNFEVEHHHGPIDDRTERPYGNGVLFWFEVEDFDAVMQRAAEMRAERSSSLLTALVRTTLMPPGINCLRIEPSWGPSPGEFKLNKGSTEPFGRKRDVLPPIGRDVVNCVGADLCANLATSCNVNRIKSSQANSGTMSTN